jgi:hypothetical protein
MNIMNINNSRKCCFFPSRKINVILFLEDFYIFQKDILQKQKTKPNKTNISPWSPKSR